MIRSRKDELPFSHPSITSFLSVPIKVRDEVYGSFFLTDKIGCPHFTSDDQSLVEALASRWASPSRAPACVRW